jgi:hypothetical protein
MKGDWRERMKADWRETDLRPVSPYARRGFEHPSGTGSWDIAAAFLALIFLIIAVAPDTDPIRSNAAQKGKTACPRHRSVFPAPRPTRPGG